MAWPLRFIVLALAWTWSFVALAQVPGTNQQAPVANQQRLSAEQLVTDLVGRGQRARFIPTVEEIVSAVAQEARDGDVVVLMSNGGFGGIHGKLLQALER